ncbi:hypothetical protein TNCV_3200431 [Trichonephila clavipes]|nr:hypothetical protein TNCV_3200431 [Trichonephila clavipes]
MEMGLSRAYADRRLNVSRNVVQGLWDQIIFEDSVSRRYVPQSTTTYHTSETYFLERETVCYGLFCCIRNKNSPLLQCEDALPQVSSTCCISNHFILMAIICVISRSCAF